MNKISDSEAEAFLKKVHEKMLPRFLSSVLPLYADQNGCSVQCGTGTLFRIANTSFVITAAHVAEIEAKDKCPLYIAGSDNNAIPVRLQTKHSLVRPQGLDVAILKLDDKTVEGLLPGCRFLHLFDVETGDNLPPTDWYYTHGYPSCWAGTGPKREEHLTCASVLYVGPTDNLGGYDPTNHLLIEWYTSGNRRFDGRPGEFPSDFGGISGSSVWRTHATRNNRRTWSPEMAKVVAVQTGKYPQRTYVRNGIESEVIPIQAVRWRALLKTLWEEYPELRAAQRIRVPRRSH